MTFLLPGSRASANPFSNRNRDSLRRYARSDIYAAPFDALAFNGLQINGGTEVSQERAGNSVVLVSGTPLYVVDCWSAKFSRTATLAITAFPNYTGVAAPDGFACSALLSATTGLGSLATNDFAYIVNFIEGYRIGRLNWGTANAQPLTVGFWVRASIAGLFCCSIIHGASAYTWMHPVLINNASTWEYKTFTITGPGVGIGTWVKDNTQGLGVYFCPAAGASIQSSGALDTWQSGGNISFTGTTNFFATTGNTFAVTGLTVLPGNEMPTALRSALLARPFDQELSLCGRYYEKSYNYSVIPGTGSNSPGDYAFPVASNSLINNFDYGALRYRFPKRATPTTTIWGISGTSGTVSRGDTAADLAASSGSTVGNGENGCVVRQGNAATQTTGNLEVLFHYTADSRL